MRRGDGASVLRAVPQFPIVPFPFRASVVPARENDARRRGRPNPLTVLSGLGRPQSLHVYKI